MQDLRLVAANERGTHLVLRSPDGDKFVVPIDERLRAAIRGDRTLLSQLDNGGGQLRPREIQARIRAGESAEQVARAAGIHVDRVRRFEGPVLAEREHMAQMCQRSSVRRPGQAELRPNTLAESLPAQLDQLGLNLTDLDWGSWRRDDGRWVVQVAYCHDGLTQLATFLFDPRARTVVAENDQARFLTGELAEHPARAPFKPRIAAAPEPTVLRAPALTPASSPALTPAPPVAPVAELPIEDELDEFTGGDDLGQDEPAPVVVRRPDPTQNRRPPDVVARRSEPVAAPTAPPRPPTVVTPPAPAATMMPPMPAPAPPPVVAASVAPPVPDPAPGTPPAGPAPRRVVVDTPTLPMEQPAEVEEMPAARTGTHDASTDEVRPTSPTPSRSAGGRRRARVPSWDDILIGTRPKD